MPSKDINGCRFYSSMSSTESLMWGRKLKKSPGILTTPEDVKRQGESPSTLVRQAKTEDPKHKK